MKVQTRLQQNCISLFTTAMLLSTVNFSLADETDSACKTDRFPNFDCQFPEKANQKRIFELSQDYPQTYYEASYPWQKLDFRNQPRKYAQEVLNYCLAGNVKNDFALKKNKIRDWYHAPWLHSDGSQCGNGRENRHGLTRELASSPYQIHDRQFMPLENWAVGFYNRPGGYTLGKVWQNPGSDPVLEEANFPEGTVSCKLLFTDGGPEGTNISKTIPFLKGTYKLTANIYSQKPYKKDKDKNKICISTDRKDREMHLLQFDIAVKDNRAEKTGWVFGTFIYGAEHGGETPWQNLVPVGLSWGNEKDQLAEIMTNGAFINPKLKETWLNKELIGKPASPNSQKAYVQHHGVGGRLNGPVDNPISSCVSCHGQAGISKAGVPLKLGAFGKKRPEFNQDIIDRFFSDVAPGANKRIFDGDEYMTLDYSLQLAAGIRNYMNDAILEKVKSAPANFTEGQLERTSILPELTRDSD